MNAGGTNTGERATKWTRPRRLLVVGVVSVVTGTLVAAVVADIGAQLQLHRTRARAAAAAARLHAATSLLASDTALLAATDHRRRAVEASLGAVTSELTSARQRLAAAQSGQSATALELGDAHACANGVSRSAAALEAGNSPDAIAALRAAAPACESVVDSGSGGAVYPFDFADPDILVTKDAYFAYGTNSAPGNIQIMESTDLDQWTKVGDALPTLASWARPGDTWAPAVIRLGRSYLLYYTAARASDGTQCISVATARRPQGPFTDSTRAPLECQPGLGGSIDPAPYVDASGRPYLTWKSNGGDGQPATIWAQALRASGTAMAGGSPTALLQPDQGWEGSVVEAPSMMPADGGYDLYYSGNDWDSPYYAIGVARCAGPTGPCVKPLSEPILRSQPDFQGPGGEDVFTDRTGQLEMAFAAWLPGAVGYPHSRLLFIRPLAVVGGIPQVGP